MSDKLQRYTALHVFKAKHPEKYWKLFAMWYDWYRVDALNDSSRYDAKDRAMLLHARLGAEAIIKFIYEEPAIPQSMIHLWHEGII